MWTKICGNTTLHDALLAAELGADALGFIFASSKRRVSVETVAAITPHLPSRVEPVGVFAEADVPFILHAVRTAGLTAVQLHFALDTNVVAKLQSALAGRVRLIQVIGVPVELPETGDVRSTLVRTLHEAFARPELFAVLLDTVQGGRSGGTGESFAWQQAAELLTEANVLALPYAHDARDAGHHDSTPRLILAGGLRAENLNAAVQVLEPWGVDVVSGVEASPGTKDGERLSRFLSVAKEL